MRPIIRVENLSKQYRIGTRDAAYETVREALTQVIRAPFKRLQRRRSTAEQADSLWALRDVNFEVYPGEVIGIIGRNGAGKSTLLKVLSRVTEPTEGRVELYGRVGSLLEVGTGFHPELTGRENIFLNGSILGMSRREITAKFDEIVSFAEVGKFIDTPVKRYSSGMYVRLAFAVAAHLEPEILVVDEVLAVGDFAFQQKCLNKMQGVSREGRTVLFVSHNMGAINRLCQRSVLLNGGSVLTVGPTSEVVQTYMTSGVIRRSEFEQPHDPSKSINLRRVSVITEDGDGRSEIGYHESFTFQLEYEVNQHVTKGSVGIGVFTADGTCAFVSGDFDQRPELLSSRPAGYYVARVKIPSKWLNTGRYILTTYVADIARDQQDSIETLVFNIIETGTPGSHHGLTHRPGVLQPFLDWHITHTEQ